MTETAETYVRSLLQDMELSLNAIMNDPSNRFGQKDLPFETLSNRLAFNGSGAVVADIYAQRRLHAMRKELSAAPTLTPEELKQKSIEFVLWHLVRSHCASVPAIRPKLHHWLPLCYTKQFSRSFNRNARMARLDQAFFNVDGTVREKNIITDTFFAHTKSEEGYYPPRIEQFFGRIESTYASLRINADPTSSPQGWEQVVTFSFFMVQAGRNPNPDGNRFNRDHRKNILANVFGAFNMYESPRIQFARDCRNLMFSPFFPPRVRKMITGVSAMVFPLDSHSAMVITDLEIDEAEAHRIATKNAATMVRHAARTGKPLYGWLAAGIA